ncbi:hypothetical protein ACF0H5_006992 [Mactra antiquata]
MTVSTIDDTYQLHEDLFKDYNRNVRPIYDQHKSMNVNVAMFLMSIHDFDEVNERFSFSAALQATWTDYKLKWNISEHNGLAFMTVSYQQVWVPELLLATPAGAEKSFGSPYDVIRVLYNGSMMWMPGNLIESTCSVNVRNYPFDNQTCNIIFVSLGYRDTEVMINAMYSNIQTDVYSPNSQWDLYNSSVVASTMTSKGVTAITFTLFLRRKPSLIVMNIIMPHLLLSIVNIFVFVLAPESGERVGFCITTLLAIAVYMTIVSDLMPQNAESIPLISYKLFADLVTSALIVLCTIMNLTVYNKEDDKSVPRWLQCLCLNRRRRRRVEPSNSKDTSKITKDVKRSKELCSDKTFDKCSDQESEPHQVTWKEVSKALDRIAIVVFTILNFVNFFVYIGLAKYWKV